MLCLTNTRLLWAVEAARVGLKKNELLAAITANWAVALRRLRYLNVQKWKRAHRERVRKSDKASYERTKVLKGRPQKLSPEEKRRRRSESSKRRRLKINASERARAASNPQFCIARRIRATLRCALKRFRAKKAYDTKTLLGCSAQELNDHLENLFLPGMSWANRELWHVDHCRPLASFDLTDPAQQREAFHFTNLQPLWAKDNQSKGARL